MRRFCVVLLSLMLLSTSTWALADGQITNNETSSSGGGGGGGGGAGLAIAGVLVAGLLVYLLTDSSKTVAKPASEDQTPGNVNQNEFKKPMNSSSPVGTDQSLEY